MNRLRPVTHFIDFINKVVHLADVISRRWYVFAPVDQIDTSRFDQSDGVPNNFI